MNNPGRDKITFILIALAIMGALSTDIYLPSLPSIAEDLATTMQMSQITLSAFLFGLTTMRLVYGPLSDFYGRRKILLFGLIVYMVSTLLCIFSFNIYILILARILQAVGICAAGVLSPAIILDNYGKRDSVKILSYIGTSVAITQIIAPCIGGYIQTYFNWRMNFIFLTIISVLLFILTFAYLKEEKQRLEKRIFELNIFQNNYLILVSRKDYLFSVLIISMLYGGIFVFSTFSANFFINLNKLKPIFFGEIYAIIVSGYILGNIVIWLSPLKLTAEKSICYGVIIAFLGSLSLLLMSIKEGHRVFPVVFSMIIFMFGAGLTIPNAMLKALNCIPSLSGGASGLMGFFQMGIASLSSVLASLSSSSSIFLVKICIFCTSFFALIFYLLSHKSKMILIDIDSRGEDVE